MRLARTMTVGAAMALLSGCFGADLASTVKVEECQDSCDTQRFFDCYDAQQHAGCYDDCASASKDDVDKFVGCVRNADFCDAACSTNIEGRSADVPAEDRVDTGREPEPQASNCESACQAMAAEMCIPGDCSPLCAESEDFRFAAVYCNSVRQGCDFPEECTGEMSPEDACLAGCDNLAFFDCIESSDQTACRQACATADDSTRENFAACTQGICEDGSCLDTLNLSASADVGGCQSACDDLSFFDCIDAGTLSACRSTCETATPESVETFKSCTMGICEDDACYTQLVSANGG